MDVVESFVSPYTAVAYQFCSQVAQFVIDSKQTIGDSQLGAQYASVFELSNQYVLRVPALEKAVDETINQGLGLNDEGLARYIAALFLAYPLGVAMPMLPAGLLRHVWAIATGVFTMMFAFRGDWLHVLLSAGSCYAVLLLGSLPGLRAWRHWLSALLSLGYLVFRHLARSGVVSAGVDYSVVQMVLTVKLYTLAYNLYDGTTGRGAIERGLAEARKGGDAKKSTVAMLEDRQRRAIPGVPGPFAFLGYVFNPTTLLCGPAFEIGVYLAATQRPRLPAEGRVWVSLWKLVQGAVWLGVSAVFKGPFGVDVLHAQASAPGADALAALPARLFTAWLVMIVVRAQYYGVWKVAEGSAVLAGYGYRATGGKGSAFFADLEWVATNLLCLSRATLGRVATGVLGSNADATLALWGVSLSGGGGHADWEGASNVTPLAVETRASLGDMTKNWNTAVQSWLELYIFKRAPRAGGLNKWLTFLASAFWHGFYPGYYLSFMTVPFMQMGFNPLYDVFAPVVPKAGKSASVLVAASWAVHWVATQVMVTYVLSPFVLLDLARGLDVWRSLHWAGHALPVVCLVLATLLRPVVGGGKPKAKKA